MINFITPLSTKWNDGLLTQTDIYWYILLIFTKIKKSFILISAQMGVSEGKSVGSWFGPNTVAQVLK